MTLATPAGSMTFSKNSSGSYPTMRWCRPHWSPIVKDTSGLSVKTILMPSGVKKLHQTSIAPSAMSASFPSRQLPPTISINLDFRAVRGNVPASTISTFGRTV